MDLFHDSQNPTPPTRQTNFSRATWKVVSAIQSTSEFASNLGIFANLACITTDSGEESADGVAIDANEELDSFEKEQEDIKNKKRRKRRKIEGMFTN